MAAALTRHQGSRPWPDPTAEPAPPQMRSAPGRTTGISGASSSPGSQKSSRWLSRDTSPEVTAERGRDRPPSSKQQGRQPSPPSLTSGKRQRLPPHVGQQAESQPFPQRRLGTGRHAQSRPKSLPSWAATGTANVPAEDRLQEPRPSQTQAHPFRPTQPGRQQHPSVLTSRGPGARAPMEPCPTECSENQPLLTG
ncbi:hypothetical protein NDU88_001515 [Pleurodeles waltl]|uniref:Uncharacterized protein n=1 Tax=Pleurodeles waltl TaxID=8319 RepID=A0AAV7UAG8_PLEWA|nr:hypothetical protein NDU88_001515 [Pleurodeles waltl]